MKEYSVPCVAGATPIWIERNGIIRASVVSGGIRGKKWIEYLEEEGCVVSVEAKNILLSSRFIPTMGVKTELAIFRSALLPYDERYTINVHEEALLRGLAMPDIEVACLLCKAIPKTFLKGIGLRWVAPMHIPVVGFENNLFSLVVECCDGEERLDTHDAKDYASWGENGGFAYKIPS